MAAESRTGNSTNKPTNQSTVFTPLGTNQPIRTQNPIHTTKHQPAVITTHYAVCTPFDTNYTTETALTDLRCMHYALGTCKVICDRLMIFHYEFVNHYQLELKSLRERYETKVHDGKANCYARPLISLFI